MAAGGELVLDDKFLKLLFQVDDRIKKISQSSGVASKSLIEMFDGASKRSVPKIIKQLQQLQQYYTEIGKDDSKGMKRLANNARKAAEDINRLIQATQQFQSTRGRRGVTQSQALSQERESIERLRESQERLNRTTEESTNQTQRNRRAQREQQAQTDGNTNSTNNLTRSHRGLLDISNQLQRKLALIFSVSQIQKYIGKIVQVRKEFELQQKALGAILRDQDRANELWDKTIQLAVKSPFSVKELITYTKQLAAYRIETDKLHDTTRMLADVSAGLGVDMNRIILAFGQVRAAEFLRGTELRQFTEAGIPMLEELADHFSELEGRAVSTADVFERISKRMVLFKDVEQVFRNMTSEGGVFYQMQEKQSETLYGQIRNLYDSIDIMMNDIGKDKNGAIQMFIRLAKSAADNWRLLEPIITSVGIAFATHFGGKTLISVVKYLGRAVVAMRSFGAASAAASATNPWLALVSVIALVGTAIYEIITYTDELTAALDEIDRNVSKELQQSIASYKELAEAITDVTKTTQEQEEAKKRLQRQFKDMLPDYLLEVEKFEDLSDAYLKAEHSLRTYFNSKALEQKKDKIEQHFQEDIDTEIANITSATRKNIEELRGVEAETKKKLKDWVGISVAQSVEAAKEGLIEVEDLENDITKRLAKAVGIDEQLLRKGYVRGSLVSSTYQDEMLDDMRKTLTKRNEMLEELKGLPFESFAQRDAAEMKHAMEEEIKTIEWYYSKMANVLKKVADGTTTLQKAEDDRAKLWQQALAQSPNLGQYAKVLDNTWQQLVESSKKGIYEYNKSLGDIKASIYLGEGGLKDIAGGKATGTSAQESMFANFSETIEMRGKDIMGKPMQKAIVGAFDYAIQKSSLSDKGKELLAQFIPDGKTTTSTVRKNIEGFITRIDDLQKEYDIATSHGALFVPDEDDQRAIDAYLQGNVELLSVYKELKPVLNHIYGLLGGEEKGSKQKKDSLADERIRVVDDMYKKYMEVIERFGHTEAMDESFKAFKDAFADAYKGIEWIPTDIKSMTAKDFVNEVLGFPSEQKIIEFFDKLANTVKNNEDKIKTELAKGKYVYELELRTQVEEDKDVIQSIERMFGQYELSLELKDLGVSEDLGKTLFGVDSIGLDDIRDSIQQKIKDDLSTEGREEYIKELKGLLQKVEEMEAKALEERMKKYAKFLEQEQTERVKIKLNEVRQLMEIEDTFRIHEKDARETYELTDEQWKAYEEQRKKGQEINLEFLKGLGIEEAKAQAILEQNQLLTAQAQIARKGVTRATQEELDKNAWEEFKKSSYYETLFADMEYSGTKSLRNLKKKVVDMKDSLKTLPPEIYKQVVESIEKIEDELTNRNPLGSLFDAWKELRKLSKEGVKIEDVNGQSITVRSRDKIAKRLEEENDFLEEKRKEIAILNQFQQANSRIRKELVTQHDILQNISAENGNIDEIVSERLGNLQSEVKVHEENIQSLSNQEQLYRMIATRAEKAQKVIQEWANATTDLLGSVDSLLDSLGVAEDSQERIWLKASMGIVDTIASVAQLIIQFTIMEVAANSALGVIGYIAMAVKAIASVFAALFGDPDKDLQKAIEQIQIGVESLQKSFDKLDKQMQMVLGADDIYKTSEDAIKTLEEQNKRYSEMMALEEAKKETDADKIREWGNEIEKNLEEMERIQNERLKELGGIGGQEEIKDAASEFVDAWLNAFLETGSGLSGLEEKFKEFAKNMVKQQLLHHVAEALVTPITTAINNAVANDGYVNDQEWDEIMATFDNHKDYMDKVMNDYVQRLGGIDSLANHGDLSGLQKGIQSIQEDTAQEIVVHMNSIRALLSQSETFYKNNEQLSSLLDNIVTDGINPMLDQLRVIANNTESIHTLLDSVVRAGHSQGGYGIKVFSD